MEREGMQGYPFSFFFSSANPAWLGPALYWTSTTTWSLSVNPIRGPAAFVASTSVFFEGLAFLWIGIPCFLLKPCLLSEFLLSN